MPKKSLTPEQIIRILELQPLPVEGGYFRRSCEADEQFTAGSLPGRYPSQVRPYYSVIYFFLTAETDCFSSLHRLPTDEVYHFYLGDPVELLQLNENGSSTHILLGQDILNGQQVQALVPRGVWQGSHLMPGGEYALLGTSMAPAYEASDFEEGYRNDLLKHYPHESNLINRLTRH